MYYIFHRCRKTVNPQGNPLSSTETCLALKNVRRANYVGYAAWNTCPRNWTEMSVRQKCLDEDSSDLLKNLPVFDEDSHVTYRNIFCARCNGAVNTKYWELQFDCFSWLNVTGFNFSTSMDVFKKNCSLAKSPESFQLKYLKRCIPRFQDCHNVSQEKNESYCQRECLRYSMPFCVDSLDFGTIRFRNPQCALCNGFKPIYLETECESGSGPVSPPLTILFDFSSTSTSITVTDRKRNEHQYVEQIWSCAIDEVFDPYIGRCKKIVSAESSNGHSHNKSNATGGNKGNKTESNPNCTLIAFNHSDFEQLPNGTVFIKSHNKIYSNTTYLVRDGIILLCVNFSRNATSSKRDGNIPVAKTTPVSLQIFTSIGCIVSMVSIVFLLITYTLFPELRNLPGKIIINLALSLLLYQSVFFSAVRTPNQERCVVVAVLLHFFVLSSFTWMNVMAYDVHRIFTASGRSSVMHLIVLLRV